jgi:hypothetical protein
MNSPRFQRLLAGLQSATVQTTFELAAGGLAVIALLRWMEM